MKITTLLISFVSIYLIIFYIGILLKTLYSDKFTNNHKKIPKRIIIIISFKVCITLIIFPIYAIVIKILNERTSIKKLLFSILVLLPELIDLSIGIFLKNYIQRRDYISIISGTHKYRVNGNESINNPFIHGSKKRGLDLVFEQFNKVEEKQLHYN